MRSNLKIPLLIAAIMTFGNGVPVGAGTPPDKKAAVDVNGNPLPVGALARLGSVSFYHEHGINVAYSGDGKILASSGGRIIRLWEPATGRGLGQFPGDRGFTLSPDGSQLAVHAVSDQGPVVIWDTRSGKELHRLSAHQGEVFALAFSPDGKQLATGAFDGTIRLWNVVSGKQEHLLAENKGYVSALAFSRDGKALFSGEYLPGADGLVQIAGKGAMTRLWDAATGQERRRFPGQAFVALSADGGVMVTAGEQTNVLHLVNWTTGETLLALKGFPEMGLSRDVNSTCFSPDGKVIATTCRGDSAIRLWDTTSGKEARSIPLAGDAFSIAFSPDGKTLAVGVLSGLGHDRIRLFDPATGNERILSNRMDKVHEVRFLADGKTLASTSADKTFRLWQPAEGKVIRVVALGRTPQAMSPDGSVVASRLEREPTRLGTGRPVREEIVELCDTSNGKVRHQLKHDAHVAQVAWSPDGALVAVGTYSGPLYLWDAVTGKLRQRWPAPTAFSMAFSPDGKTLATGDDDCTVKLLQVANGRLIRQLGISEPERHDSFGSSILIITVSPDGKSIASAFAGQSAFTVWDASSGKVSYRTEINPVWPAEGWVYALAFSPDGKTLFSGGADRAVHQWDAATGKEILQLQGHRGAVVSLALSPDGSRLASGSTDGTILIWDLVSSTK